MKQTNKKILQIIKQLFYDRQTQQDIHKSLD